MLLRSLRLTCISVSPRPDPPTPPSSNTQDAVTGTARQHVTYDYAKMLAAGVSDAVLLLRAAAAQLTGFAAGNFSLCELSNATICPPLEAPVLGQPPTLVLLYNPGSLPRVSAPVRLPVGLPAGVASWGVKGPDGEAPVLAQLLPPSERDLELREGYYGAPPAPMAWLAFQVPSVPPLGYAAFFLAPAATLRDTPSTHPSQLTLVAPSEDPVLTNGVLTLTLSGATGLATALEDASSGVAAPLAQELFYYRASAGCPLPPLPCNIANDGTGLSAYGQSATTYIFRPNSSTPQPLGAASLQVVRGPVLSEARAAWGGGWASSVLRLWANSSSLEHEWTVGPVPLGDGWGKEVVAGWRVGGGWGSGSPPTLYTDSMGRELQKRVLNTRAFPGSNVSAYEPIAANYYPVVARAVLPDPATGRRFTLTVDRASGCASLAPGALECVLHRRHVASTFLGMGEVLNETGLNAEGDGLLVRGVHQLRFDADRGSGAARGGAALEAAQLPLMVLLAPLPAGVGPLPPWARAHTTQFSGLVKGALPPQLRVLTAAPLGGGGLLLRVAHAYEVGEDGVLSANATVALGGLFSAFNVTGVVETSMGGVVPLGEVKKWTLRVQGEAEAVTLPLAREPVVGPAFLVGLAAMEVRTFVCKVGGVGVQ